MNEINGVTKELTPAERAAERIAAIEKRREARKVAGEEPRILQLADDLEAFERLEEQYGEGKVVKLPLPYFTKGLPTFVVVRAPEEQYVKRMRGMIRQNPKNPGAAMDLLADKSVAYPDPDTYKNVRAEYGGIHDSVGNAAVELSQARKVEEGKD